MKKLQKSSQSLQEADKKTEGVSLVMASKSWSMTIWWKEGESMQARIVWEGKEGIKRGSL